MRRRGAAALASLVVLVLPAATGCAEVTAPAASTKVDVDTPALRALKKQAQMADCPRPGGRPSRLPDVTLPCLGGGRDVALRTVAGPAVVAVWAQWCAPCRKELPWYQRLHAAAGDRLTVLGLDWQDLQPEGALRLAAMSGVRFPSVADVDARLEDGRRGLPLVYFVRPNGSVWTKRGQLSGYQELRRLVEEHTGVHVGGR